MGSVWLASDVLIKSSRQNLSNLTYEEDEEERKRGRKTKIKWSVFPFSFSSFPLFWDSSVQPIRKNPLKNSILECCETRLTYGCLMCRSFLPLTWSTRLVDSRTLSNFVYPSKSGQKVVIAKSNIKQVSHEKGIREDSRRMLECFARVLKM